MNIQIKILDSYLFDLYSIHAFFIFNNVLNNGDFGIIQYMKLQIYIRCKYIYKIQIYYLYYTRYNIFRY